MKILKLSDLKDQTLNNFSKEVQHGAIAIIPTDTIYGIIGSVKLPKTVEKIYKLRKRASSKPMIILAASLEQIIDLGLKVNLKQAKIFKKLWPNQISIVINCPSKKLHYLHRGKKSLAFRIPNNDFLLRLLKLAGPIVAPSANFEGEKPSENIDDAREYFKDAVDFYIDGGQLDFPPSTVVKLEKLKLIVLREGAVKIPKDLLI